MADSDSDHRSKLREGLLWAGEKLIGESGVDGVSMRRVSVLAGTRNNYAVQYHFTDLDGLIRAIIARRTPEIEERRRDALDAPGERRALSHRGLLDAFFLPLLDLVDDLGVPRFARFMNALHKAPEGWRPLDEMFFMMPVTERILDLMTSAISNVPAPVIWQRLRPVSVMVLTFATADPVVSGSKEYRQSIRASLLDMAAAALATPVREDVASKVYGFLF